MQPCLSLVLPVPDRKKNAPPFRSRRAVAALAGPGMVKRTGQLHTSSTLTGLVQDSQRPQGPDGEGRGCLTPLVPLGVALLVVGLSQYS